MQENTKVLISTIHPTVGGIPAMLKFVIDCLRERNFEITLAYYRPYSTFAELSVPLHKTLTMKPSHINEQFYGVDCVGIGCWLPELEVTHYWFSKQWQQLIQSHDKHLVVSGSCMAALPFVQSATPFLGWVASDWQGDREQRVKSFPWFRRLVDIAFITPFAKFLERRIVNTKQLVALSEHTKSELNKTVKHQATENVLRMPIDADFFVPAENKTLNYQIGFVSRFEDPRKNLTLLLESFALIVKERPNVQLVLVGDTLSKQTHKLLEQLKITSNVTSYKYLGKNELLEVLHTLDLFILPSYQEGLCIAALEAMSCGVPVVSTRCGGPESYIVDGENGNLCEHEASAISRNVLQLYSDEQKRSNYAASARKTVLKRFSKQAQIKQFWTLFEAYTS